MTLKKEYCDIWKRWEWVMYTNNAVNDAWNNGHAIPKYFASLEAVETKYKSWRGVATLLAA